MTLEEIASICEAVAPAFMASAARDRVRLALEKTAPARALARAIASGSVPIAGNVAMLSWAEDELLSALEDVGFCETYDVPS